MIKIRKDLTNQRFGRFVVLSRADDIVYSNGQAYSAWLCQCDCGNKKVVVGTSLNNGSSTNCGCIRSEKTIARNKKNNENLIGSRFGMLVVESKAEDILRSDNKWRTAWNCRCDCGNTTVVTENDLKTNNTKSCGCFKGIKIRERSFEDLKGNKYGKLLVISRAPDYIDTRGKHNANWHCLCDCGNECDVTASSLKSGNAQSCGCYRYDRVAEVLALDLTGQTFGKLKVVKKGKGRRYKGIKRVTWLCECECGNKSEVTTNALTSGNTMSCGCMKSGLEVNVLRYLNDKNYIQDVDFIYQVKFEGLKGDGGRELSYNFGLLEDRKIVMLLECQGRQHYEALDYFGGEEQFEIQKRNDKKKRNYAKANGIPLIEIPYTIHSYQKMKKYLFTLGI